MKVIVTDTNVFIDLIKSNALDLFFQCPFEVCTTDLVLTELVPDQQEKLAGHIEAARLQVLELSSLWVMRAIWTYGISDRERMLDMLEKLSMNARLPKGVLEELKNEVQENQ